MLPPSKHGQVALVSFGKGREDLQARGPLCTSQQDSRERAVATRPSHLELQSWSPKALPTRCLRLRKEETEAPNRTAGSLTSGGNESCPLGPPRLPEPALHPGTAPEPPGLPISLFPTPSLLLDSPLNSNNNNSHGPPRPSDGQLVSPSGRSRREGRDFLLLIENNQSDHPSHKWQSQEQNASRLPILPSPVGGDGPEQPHMSADQGCGDSGRTVGDRVPATFFPYTPVLPWARPLATPGSSASCEQSLGHLWTGQAQVLCGAGHPSNYPT